MPRTARLALLLAAGLLPGAVVLVGSLAALAVATATVAGGALRGAVTRPEVVPVEASLAHLAARAVVTN